MRPLALIAPVLALTGSLVAAPQPADAVTTKPLRGTVIVLDPGHNAHNSRIPASCNTTGTATASGYPEHVHTWDVARRTAASLRALGATVVLTRTSDTGVGPCTSVRAATAARVHADLLLSIHDDGAPARLRGFHVISTDERHVPGPRRAAGLRLAVALRDAIGTTTGLPRASWINHGSGLDSRSDLVTLNGSAAPAALVELGNMRNRTDAALLTSASFRAREAAALVRGVRTYLHR